MTRPRLLYLGFAFPPGVSGLFPEMQPAGHLIETSLIDSIRPWFEVRSVGLNGVDVERLNRPLTASPGLPHALHLLEAKPELLHRLRALGRLRRAYAQWRREGWRADVIVVCNLSPVYNGFIRWLRRQLDPPLLVLYLADSTQLGLHLPALKRLRYRFKPLTWFDEEMVDCYDACVAVSRDTEPLFRAHGLPWLWLPNGCDPARTVSDSARRNEGPVAFGYFGALAEYTGVPGLLRVFTAKARNATLHLCGYGKARSQLVAEFGGRPGVHFYEPRTPDECLHWAQQCDVLVNPRPIHPGNQNNFSSKVFEYGASGRAILSSRLSGVDAVLGPEAFYFEASHFEPSLSRTLDEIAEVPREELNGRGAAIQQRLLREFAWPKQGERLARFLKSLLAEGGRQSQNS
jgi:glycosyltransferase involved in cell wall biosynthesis